MLWSCANGCVEIDMSALHSQTHSSGTQASRSGMAKGVRIDHAADAFIVCLLLRLTQARGQVSDRAFGAVFHRGAGGFLPVRCVRKLGVRTDHTWSGSSRPTPPSFEPSRTHVPSAPADRRVSRPQAALRCVASGQAGQHAP